MASADTNDEESDDEANEPTRKLSKKEQAQRLRDTVDSTGKIGGLGQNTQHVISVAMLTEGWDAKNVTHVMGLRAFSSHLLCEQVVGRALRLTRLLGAVSSAVNPLPSFPHLPNLVDDPMLFCFFSDYPCQ